MLTILRNIIERDITLSKLFEEMKFPVSENAERRNEFDIKVKTEVGYRQIEGFRFSESLPTARLTVCLKSNKMLKIDAAFKHLVMTDSGWKYIKDLNKNIDKILTVYGFANIEKIEFFESTQKILYDMQVADTHSFFANGILSHNSHFLVQLGANALRAGKNVLHYTFELSEHKVGIRYDANISGVGATDVPDEKEFIKKKYSELSGLGRLIIKEYPTNTATIMMLQAHIEKLAITKSFRPDLIIIDYADLMRSSRQFDSLRHELKLVYEELRGMSMQLGIPLWSASQSNRGSSDSEIISLSDVSESFGKMMVCDFVLTLARKPLQKSKGLCNIFIPKNRLGKDGLLFPAKIDTARSIIEIMNEAVDMDEFEKSHENNTKQLLRDKWKEVSDARLLEFRESSKRVVNGDVAEGSSNE